MPRPDTYIISGEVTMKSKDVSTAGETFVMKEYYRQIDISVSIFPSLESMLTGTIAGSILGTIVAVYSKDLIK